MEQRDNGAWLLRTSDLESFQQVLGEKLLFNFCRCYIQADRLNSLIGMYSLSTSVAGKETVRGKRDFNTVLALASGLLKELSVDLGDLKFSLIERGLFDKEEWLKGLQKWESWGADKDISHLRNKFAFHVDDEWLRKGLADLMNRSEETAIYAGDDRKLGNSWFPLAHAALFQGAKLVLRDAGKAFGSVEKNLEVQTELDTTFLSTLERAGLKPLLCRFRG